MAPKSTVDGRTIPPSDTPAREHSSYGGEPSKSKPQPREKGDYNDPVKRETGRGNASKGPWKDQGGTGHGENYGARKDDDRSADGSNKP